MTGAEHILCWIESSKPHYDRLLAIWKARRSKIWSLDSKAESAVRLATSAYREMIRGGDAYTSDHSARSILEAAILIVDWELEQ